ncbi:cellulose binding domain-containing protein [Actinosynnema sp. NPDC023794]
MSDVSVYTDNSQSYPAPPAEVLLTQAYRYRDFFELYKEYSQHISSVTLWGLADDSTWLDSFPVTRKDHPLLFDTRLQAKDAYWGVVDPSKIGGPTSTTTVPPATCAVAYRIGGQWQGGFQGEVRITNRGATAISAWTLAWSFPDGQRITQLWGGAHTQTGAAVSVRHAAWNSMIAPGGSVSFGFLGSWTGSNGKPTAFTLNGAPCQS